MVLIWLFLRKEVNKKVGYNSKRGRDRINFLSRTIIGVYDQFWIADLLSRCSSWFWDKVWDVLRKLFISNWLLDNSEAWRASNGRFGCWNFPFDCVGSFGKSGRRIGADTNSCNTSENHGRRGKIGAIRTILHQDWRILARTEDIRIVGGNAYAWRQFQFIVCLCCLCWGFTAQSIQWGQVEWGQFI